ncbi:hypothetical protein ACFV3T_06120 [Streptomyces albidoflavus]
MSRRGGSRPPSRGIIVLAGESSNDRRLLASFIRANHPELLATATMTEITDQVRLRKKTGPELAHAADTLVRKARGKAKLKSGPFVGIAVHEDMDAPTGPDYTAVRQAVSAAPPRPLPPCTRSRRRNRRRGFCCSPTRSPCTAPPWRVPAQWRGRDTGRRSKPKEDLEAEFRQPPFRESDGPEIVKKALDQGMLSAPCGTNRSYTDFIADLAAWQVPGRRH